MRSLASKKQLRLKILVTKPRKPAKIVPSNKLMFIKNECQNFCNIEFYLKWTKDLIKTEQFN